MYKNKDIKFNLLDATPIKLLSRTVENLYVPEIDLHNFFVNYYDDIDNLLQSCQYSTAKDGSRYLNIEDFKSCLVEEEKWLNLLLEQLKYALSNIEHLQEEYEQSSSIQDNYDDYNDYYVDDDY